MFLPWLALVLPVFAAPRDTQDFRTHIIKRQSSNATGPVVDLGYATYQGVANSSTGLNTFKGVRYAAPPTGQNRWQPPQAPANNRSQGVIPATTFASRCPQSGDAPYTADPCPDLQNQETLPDACKDSRAFQRSIAGDEDCLFLNVYAPPDAKDLPVLVWIHGGGYGAGDGTQDLSFIINANNKGFVGVAIQYRLGAFGFLSSDEVYRFGSVNAGLLDQSFALQWVQSHIDKFGGDASKVTISGESAGGGSVMLQDMAYGGTQGTALFTQTITASPYLPEQYGYADFLPSQSYYAFAYQAGCFDGTPFLNESQTILQCLRGRDTFILQQVSAIVSATGRFGQWGFLPVTDGDFVQDRPSRQLQQKKLNGQRILSGNNANEGPSFTTQDITTYDDFLRFLHIQFPRFNDTDMDTLLQYYSLPGNATTSSTLFATTGDAPPTALNQSSFGTGYQQLADDVYAETTFVCPSYWLAEAYTDDKTSYKYQFSVTPAQHGGDVAGYFNPLSAPYIGPDFGAAFQQIWGNFITTGNPSIPNAVANGLSSYNFTGHANDTPNDASSWPPYTLDTPLMLNLNQTGGTPSFYTLAGTDTEPGMPPSDASRFVVEAPDDVYNATAGDAGNGTGRRVSVSGSPVLRNDLRLVDANAWEGGRYARCEFWRGVGARVPE